MDLFYRLEEKKLTSHIISTCFYSFISTSKQVPTLLIPHSWLANSPHIAAKKKKKNPHISTS